MTIRLTSPETINRVLEKMKRDERLVVEENNLFFKYCGQTLRECLEYGDECYIKIEWQPSYKPPYIIGILRYDKRSEMMTDVEYLNEE